jgi:hypothetical protein
MDLNEQLRTLVVSFIALAVALVIATKELILCLSGAIVRAASKSYSIETESISRARGGCRGPDLFPTTLLEIGPGNASHQYTGRAIVLPNSLLLTNPVIMKRTRTTTLCMFFFIPLNVGENWQSG